MITETNDLEIYISATSIIISVLAFLYTRRSTKIAERAVLIAEKVKRQNDYEYAQTYPSIDILKVIEVDNKHRVILHLCNMRANPFRINKVSVHKRVNKKRSIRNYIESIVNKNFDWDYEDIDGYAWNPKGNLDDSEKFFEEAGEFIIVKHTEKILVTIPEYSEYATYRFTVDTTHGTVTLAASPTKHGNTYFCKEFRQSIVSAG
jgi:hypothetical protein